ncbi:hypothetical protein [Nocardia sp. NPDC019255]|uniref:hypothetical protein n=1 Tax=Nocardia sp. NPDC019255 TaxID=3154591 RepID=UPI0033C9B570
MNAPLRLVSIAGEVLERAALLDPRIKVEPAVIEAWADMFDGQKIWLTEALAAVKHHYLKTNPFPIMPGDVVAFCAEQPVYSSRDHAGEFLTVWSREPYSGVIEAHTGIQPPEIAIPDSLPRDQHRAFLADHLAAWVEANRERLVTAILERRHNAVIQ